jgi:HEAT repeat protein
VLTQLLRSLEHGGIDPSGSELGIFLKHLQPAAMPVLLSAIEQSAAGVLQDRLRSAMEGLAAAHQKELIRLLSHEDTDVLRGAARLAGQLGLADATAPLGALLTQPETAVRRAAVDALIRIRSGSAMEALRLSLADEDRDIRVTAARGIAGARYTPARAWFEKLIDSREVRGADLTEKMAFFEAYGSVANEESVAMLDRMLNGRRLFAKESAEVRACAAMALGRVGTPAAQTALERARGENNPIIRNAVARALREQES